MLDSTRVGLSLTLLLTRVSMNNRKSQNQHLDSSGVDERVHAQAIRQLLRARTRLIVCFWTLPVYILIVWVLLSNRQPIDLFMFFYFSLCAGFWIDMVRRRCPVCAKQFYVKSVLLNLNTRKCVHCSFSTGRNFRE